MTMCDQPDHHHDSAVSAGCESSFSSLSAYCQALLETPQRTACRAGMVGTAEAELHEMRARSGQEMQRQLHWYDVMGLGVGGMVGAGIFVATGRAANQAAGPAIIVSYAVAGLAALLSALCYTDFAVQVPAAGGAFSYLHVTFGELAAYLSGANLIMEYVISNAAVARSFTSYFATAFGVNDSDRWRVSADGLAYGYNKLDFPAMALVSVMTFSLCRSTKHSSTFNIVITILHLALIVFIIAAGFAKGSFTNLFEPSGFAPFGAKGIFKGAATVFYSYVGYDCVSTLAEETHKPAKTMPIGISGSVMVVTVLYCVLATSLVLLVPYDQIDVFAPFPKAFSRRTAGWKWASNVVALCACVGIVSSLMVAMLGQARYLCVIGRANLIPAWFAKVNSSTGTPLNASLTLGACTAVVAFFTELDVLVDLLNIGILFVFYMVSNASILRRHVSHDGKGTWPTAAFLVVCSCTSVAFATLWVVERQNKALELGLCGGTLAVSTVAFKVLVSPSGDTRSWWSPVMLYVGVASVFLNIFLVASLQSRAFKRFAYWTAATLLFYLLYSVHAAHDAERWQSYAGKRAKASAVPTHEYENFVTADNLQMPVVVVVQNKETVGNALPISMGGVNASGGSANV